MKKLKLVMVGDGVAGVRTLEELLRIAPDEGCTPKFALWVEGGQVHLDRAELAELGARLPLPVAGPALRCQPA